MRELAQYSEKPSAPKQPKVSQGYLAASTAKKFNRGKTTASTMPAVDKKPPEFRSLPV
jgi:hypothetical protein